MIDSGTVSKQIRDTTEFLFSILSRPAIYAGRPSVLVACNKQDLGLVKGATAIQGLLEKEMNALRVSRSNRLEGIKNRDWKNDLDKDLNMNLDKDLNMNLDLKVKK